MTEQEKLNLVTNYFAEDWAIKSAIGLLEDYEKMLEAQQSYPTPHADSQPKAQFDDPKVQAVYTILCDDADWPPKENPQQHWEGWIARRIVDALLADSVLEDAARYRWLRNKSTVLHNTAWLGGATAVQRDVDFLRRDDALAALDAAIDAARKQGASHD